MPQYRVTARLLVTADNETAALEDAALMVGYYDPAEGRYLVLPSSIIAAELRIERTEPRSQGAAA